MSQIGELIINLRAELGQFRTDMIEASKHVQNLRGDFQQLGIDVSKVLQGLTDSMRSTLSFFGLGFGVRELIESTKSSLEFAASIYDQSRALGIATGALQQYQFAAKQAGVSQTELAAGIISLTRNMAIATTPSASGGLGANARGARALESLGVPLMQSNGELRATSDALSEVLPKLASMQDQTRALADAIFIFGKSAGPAFLGMARQDLPALL
jgi:hypothetical protein